MTPNKASARCAVRKTHTGRQRRLGLALGAFLVGVSVHSSTRAAPAASFGAHSVWVANEKDNTLTVLDDRTWAIKATVATCKRPRHVQAYKSERLYVACSSDDQIDVIDPASGQSLGRLPGGHDPELFDISPDGKHLFIASEDSGELLILDIAKAKVVQRIAVGGEPEGVAVSADGQYVFVASEAEHHVAVVDVAKGVVVKKIPAGKRARRLALAAGGKELWVSNELEGTLSVIDTQSLAVVHTLRIVPVDGWPSPPLPAGLQASPDGKTMYVGLGRANHVAVIDVPTRTVKAMVPAGKRVWGVGLNSAGTVLMAAGGLSDDLTVVDAGTFKVLQTVTVGKAPQSIAVID